LAWIELHQAIWTHRKTLILAAELDLDETYAAAHVVRLWTWALDNAPEGDLTNLPARVIAFGAGWRGDPELFVNAAVKAGWIDKNERVLIHDWMEYAGRLIEKRKADAERKRQWRENNQDVQRMSNGRDADATRDGECTVPYRTLPNNIINTSATPLELAALNLLKSVSGYPFDYETDLAFIRTLAVDFPEMDLVGEIKKWGTYKMDKPLRQKSNPRLQLRNWMVKSKEFNKNKPHMSKPANLFPTQNEPPEDWQYPPGYGEG
jgi:hypothetical protein